MLVNFAIRCVVNSCYLSLYSWCVWWQRPPSCQALAPNREHFISQRNDSCSDGAKAFIKCLVMSPWCVCMCVCVFYSATYFQTSIRSFVKGDVDETHIPTVGEIAKRMSEIIIDTHMRYVLDRLLSRMGVTMKWKLDHLAAALRKQHGLLVGSGIWCFKDH